MYRYIPAAVVCNIMITLPGCLAASPLPRFPPTRPRLRGHPLSAAMLPGNMIIVIICTLLRPHPPDSSPPRGNPLILSLFSLSLSLSLFLSFFRQFVPPSSAAMILATLSLLSSLSRPRLSDLPSDSVLFFSRSRSRYSSPSIKLDSLSC